MTPYQLVHALANRPGSRRRAEWSALARRVLARLPNDADLAGWQPWDGRVGANRKRPCQPERRIEVKYRNGTTAGPARAMAFLWSHFNEADDIVAWRFAVRD